MCWVRQISQWLIIGLLAITCLRSVACAVRDLVRDRERMINEQLVARGIHAQRVLAAMRKVPREEFVPEEVRNESYKDGALPIGHDQTISQPYIVAFMTEQLRLERTDRILEIGTGSGYQAAVLAELVADVCTVEIIGSLAQNAKAVLQRLGYTNVHVKLGDKYEGWPEHEPFDAIIVTCAIDHVLVTQLKERGRMMIPVGESFAKELYLFQKGERRI